MTAPLETRVRSYLDANCAHCHQPGVNNAHFDARLHTPLMSSGLIHGPVLYDLGIANAHIITPRQPSTSLARLRMAIVGDNQMPPIGRNQVDVAAVDAITAWINALDPAFVSLIARDDHEVTEFQTAVTVAPLDNDDGEGLVIDAVISPPDHAQVTVADDLLTLVYTPVTGHEGADTFTYRARDADGNKTNIATITVTTASAETSQDLRFLDRSSWLPEPGARSGVAMAVVDMNADGRDDLVHFDGAKSLMIDYQTSQEGIFTHDALGSFSEKKTWTLAIADVDDNGRNDLLFGGYYDGLHMLKATGTGTFVASILPNSDVFLQGTNLADIDNDGWLDIFACNDYGDSLKFRNDGAGGFLLANELLDTTTAVASDNSGNYGTVWTDYDSDGDLDMYLSKCKSTASSATDPRRINMLFRNDGDGGYDEVAAEAGLKLGEQSWAADFGDIDNDGDLDAFVGNHKAASRLFVNNGDGTFTDRTSAHGIAVGFNVIQCLFRDFDNDGWLDLLLTGSKTCFYRNRGEGRFQEVGGLFSGGHMESCAIGDLNHDGFLDIYAGYARLYNTPTTIPDRLFINEANSNGFLAVTLEGVTSNRSAIGARLELHGAWGIQVREVRAGESYGITNSLTKVFGLGNNLQADRLIIRWPSGTVDEMNRPAPNQFLYLREGFSKLTFSAWQAQTPGAGTTSTSNHDGDAFDDLLEFALGGDPSSATMEGLGPRLEEVDGGVLQVRYTRPDDRQGLAYQLEQSVDLQVWTPIGASVDGGLVTAPLSTSSCGFVRLKVTHIESGEVRWTQPSGWMETEFHQGYQTHSVALLKPALYQSLIIETEGSVLELSGAGLSLPIGGAHYLEIIDGPHEGHRLEVVGHDGVHVTVDLASRHNTISTIPEGLVGSTIVIRAHWTLSDVYKPTSFQAGMHLDESDQIQFFKGTRFEGVFLLDHPNGSPQWVATGDGDLSNQAGRVMAPGGGCFVSRASAATTTVRLLGQVRDHDFRVTLHPGHALVSSGFPMDSTPSSFDFDVSPGFTAATDPAAADQIQCWQGDITPGAAAYDSYFLLEATTPYWTGATDLALADRSTDLFFGGDRAFFLRLQRETAITHQIRKPW